MVLTNEFIEAVENKKKTRVRIMLKDTLLVDPSFRVFNEMLEYAECHILDLYDKHNEEELNNNSLLWDEDYMNQQMVAVVSNFSKERVDLLKKIVTKLYEHKIQNDISGNYETANTETSVKVTENDNKLNSIQVAGGVITVIGAGAMIGGVVSSSASVVIVGGVVLAGGIAMVTLSRSKGE
jgi:hypothetical protein